MNTENHQVWFRADLAEQMISEQTTEYLIAAIHFVFFLLCIPTVEKNNNSSLLTVIEMLQEYKLTYPTPNSHQAAEPKWPKSLYGDVRAPMSPPQVAQQAEEEDRALLRNSSETWKVPVCPWGQLEKAHRPSGKSQGRIFPLKRARMNAAGLRRQPQEMGKMQCLLERRNSFYFRTREWGGIVLWCG